MPDQIQPGGPAPRLRRRGPHRARAEVIEIRVSARRIDLLRSVAGLAQQHVRADQLARHRDRQILLPGVQHVGAGRDRDVRPIVDGQKLAVGVGDLAQDGQRCELLRGLHRPQRALAGRALVAQLDDVHPRRQRRIREPRQLAETRVNVAASIGDQVQGRIGELPAARVAHVRTPGRNIVQHAASVARIRWRAWT